MKNECPRRVLNTRGFHASNEGSKLVGEVDVRDFGQAIGLRLGPKRHRFGCFVAIAACALWAYEAQAGQPLPDDLPKDEYPMIRIAQGEAKVWALKQLPCRGGALCPLVIYHQPSNSDAPLVFPSEALSKSWSSTVTPNGWTISNNSEQDGHELSLRVYTLGKKIPAAYVVQTVGFEHLKRSYTLVAVVGGEAKVVWSARDPQGPFYWKVQINAQAHPPTLEAQVQPMFDGLADGYERERFQWDGRTFLRSSRKRRRRR